MDEYSGREQHKKKKNVPWIGPFKQHPILSGMFNSRSCMSGISLVVPICPRWTTFAKPFAQDLPLEEIFGV
jgi:hypothetical protein